jgi:hypothetical protein
MRCGIARTFQYRYAEAVRLSLSSSIEKQPTELRIGIVEVVCAISEKSSPLPPGMPPITRGGIGHQSSGMPR